MFHIKIGDKVMLRGDRLKTYDNNQLIDGKYVKKHNTNIAWVGVVENVKLLYDDEQPYIKIGAGWRGIEMYEKID